MPAVRKVLQIAFDFPPRRTSGVYRSTAMAKYLPRYGWRPTVLTAGTKPGEVLDATLLVKVPRDVTVVRTPYWAVDWWDKPAASSPATAAPLTSSGNGTPSAGRRQLLRAAAGFVRSVLYFPDETVGWVPFALEQAIELHLKERFDVVYTTSPQRVTHVFGLLLKRWFNLPWVAEFRDPWPLPKRPLRRELEWRLQTSILRHADAVVPVAVGHAESLCADYRLPAEKVSVITNGFDEEDFTLDGRPSDLFDPQYVHISHFGTVYPNLSGKFFEALLELVREDPSLTSRLRVNIVGFPDAQVQHYAQQPELREVIRLFSFLPHTDAVQAMRSTDCLLMFRADPDVSRLAVAAKLYEYLRSGRPILAIATEGGAKELLERTKAGRVVHPEDLAGIKQAVCELLARPSRLPERDPATDAYLARFSHGHLAGEMAAVLDRVAYGR